MATPKMRGQMIQQSASSWLLRVYIGRTEDGKRRYINKTIQGSRLDANKALAKLLVGTDSGTEATTVAGLAVPYIEEWVSNRVDITANTRMQYEHRVTKDIAPFFAAFKLGDLTPTHIERWIKWMTEERHLSPRTVRYSYVILHSALEVAVIRGHLGKHPCVKVKLPAKDHHEIEYLTPDEVQKLLEATEGSPDHPLWATLLHTGMRPQEAFALKWSDFDPKGATLTIRRARKKQGDGTYADGATKRKASNRTLGLEAYLVETLKKHRTSIDPDSYLFTTTQGTPLDISNVRKRWATALKNAGVKNVTLYATRHTHATGLLLAGVNLKVVSERLGHSSIQITADTYTHVLPSMDAQAATIVGQLFTPRSRLGVL